MTGTEKFMPLIIGKSQNPRGFTKNYNRRSLKCIYKFNKKAWMVKDIFVPWVGELEERCKKQNRKVLLLMDNFSGHNVDSLKLKYVRVLFLPPNTTSLSQPLDQGIINNAKAFYKKELIEHYWNLKKSDFKVEPINVRQAIRFFVKAWKKVKPVTIANCFKKALPGIHENLYSEKDDDNQSELGEIDPEIKKHFFPNNSGYSFDEFVNCDDNLITNDPNETLTTTIEEATGISEDVPLEDGETTEEESDSDVENEEEKEPFNFNEMEKSISQILVYSNNCDPLDTDEDIEKHRWLQGYLKSVRDKIKKEYLDNLKQESILNYFKPINKKTA